MRGIIGLICFCALLFGCSAHGTSAQSGELESAGDTWKTNKIIIKAAESSGNLDVALITATSEVTARPENSEARIVLARLQTRTGQPDQALLTLDPLMGKPNAEVSLERARAELALGNTEKVPALLDQAVSDSPSRELTRDVEKLRAIAFDITGNHSASQALYKKLLGERDETGVRYNYGRSLMASGDYGQAVSMLLPLVELYELPQARAAAAAAMAKNKNFKGARNLLHGYMPEEDIDRVIAGGGAK